MMRTVLFPAIASLALAGCSTIGEGGDPFFDALQHEPVGDLLGARAVARNLELVCDQVAMGLGVEARLEQLREDRPEEAENVTAGDLSRAEALQANAFAAASGFSFDLAGTPRDQWDKATVCPASATGAGSQTLVGLMLVPV